MSTPSLFPHWLSRRLPLGPLIVNIIVLATGSTMLFAQSKAPAKQGDPGIGFVWSKRDAGGADLGIVSDIRGPVTHKVGTKGRKNADGSVAEIKNVFGQTSQPFTGTDTYYCDLNPSLRGKVTFVEIKIRPAVVQNADAGTIINVDGAVIGFAQVAKNRGTAAVELLIRDLGKDGKPAWVKTGLVYALNPQDHKPAPIRVSLRLDHKNKVWAIFLNSIVWDEFIALTTTEPNPIFSIRAGAGQTARLEKLDILEGAPRGNGRFPTEASMDLAQARRNGTKDIFANGEKMVHPTPPVGNKKSIREGSR